MIQQAQHSRQYLVLVSFARGTARFGRAATLCAAVHACVACGGATPQEPIPRTLEGHTQLSAFVPPFAYEAYVRGELALSQGAFEEAAAQFELATAAPEEDPYLLSRLAWAQGRAGHGEAAEQSLDHAFRLDACSEAAWLTRAELAELAGDSAKADTAYARASECAPLSPRAPIARARALDRAGKPGAALEVLGAFSSPEEPARARVALETLLRGSDPAVLAYALETWLAYEAPDAVTLQRAARWALERGYPALAARIREHYRGPFPKPLDAQISRALGDRAAVRALLSQAVAEELGGSSAAAELALFADDPARAELEATNALASGPADLLLALRAKARFALGRHEDALADVRAIGDATIRRQTLLALVAKDGSPALAEELSELGDLTSHTAQRALPPAANSTAQ